MAEIGNESKQIPKSNWVERLQQRNIDNAQPSADNNQVNDIPKGDVTQEQNELNVVEDVLKDVKSQNKGLSELQDVNDDNSESVDTEQTVTDTPTADDTNTEKPWWESDDSVTNVDTNSDATPTADFSSLGNALGIEGASEEAITNEFKSLKDKITEYETQLESNQNNSQFANDEIRVANEISKNGGDWKSYLQIESMDWNSVDDTALLVEFGLKPVYGNEDATINEVLQDYKPHQIKREAHNIRQGLINEQKAEMQRIQSEATQKKTQINNSIKDALQGTNEMYGMKFNDSMKKDLYDSITSNDFINSIFYDDNGNLNPKRIVETAFLVNNIKDIVKTNINVARNQGVKQIMDEVSQPQIRQNGDYAAPKQQKPLSRLDKAMASLRGGK